MLSKIREFLKKEAVLSVSALCAVLTVVIIPPDAEYLHYIDFRVLCLLLSLMTVVAGFKSVGTFQWLTGLILNHVKSGRALSITLVLLPFFSSMLVTNDVALLIFIPFTLLLLQELQFDRETVPIIVLQTVAANLGSMATPVGNPQNLFLYGAFDLTPNAFFGVVLPLTLVSFICLFGASCFILPKNLPQLHRKNEKISSVGALLIYVTLFALCLLTVFRVVHYLITTAIILLFVISVNRKLLKEVDLMLLATFVCFFVVSENLGRMDIIRSFLQSLLTKNTFMTSIGASQIISNVPAAVLLAGFTDQWKQLLAGVNIGGLGTPIASLASLITLKFYLKWPGARIGRFLLIFTLANLIGLLILSCFFQIMI